VEELLIVCSFSSKENDSKVTYNIFLYSKILTSPRCNNTFGNLV